MKQGQICRKKWMFSYFLMNHLWLIYGISMKYSWEEGFWIIGWLDGWIDGFSIRIWNRCRSFQIHSNWHLDFGTGAYSLKPIARTRMRMSETIAWVWVLDTFPVFAVARSENTRTVIWIFGFVIKAYSLRIIARRKGARDWGMRCNFALAGGIIHGMLISPEN